MDVKEKIRKQSVANSKTRLKGPIRMFGGADYSLSAVDGIS